MKSTFNTFPHLLLAKCACMTFMLFASLGVLAQKTYVVCVGLNVYDDGENSLPCSRADAYAMADFFKKYNNSDVFVLLDKNATRDHILRVLKAKFSKATERDEVIFAYSGHGFDGGISCYDTKNIIYCSEIQKIMRGSKAKRKIMFVNSCHSGSFSKRYYNERYSREYKSSNSNVMLYLSSRADELSWELYEMKHSFFFHHLLMGLKGHADKNGDNAITARELFNYVNARVVNDTNGFQNPQMYGKFADDMIVVKTR